MAAAAAKSNLSSLSQSAATSGFDILQFQAFNSAVDIQFWYELGRNKLDHLQLSNKALEIVAGYTNALNQHIPSQLTLGEYSFHEIQEFKNISNQTNNDNNNNSPDNKSTGINHLPAFHVPYRGQLYISNTLDEFIHMNTSVLLDKLRDEIWESIKSGSALNSSAYHLNRFLLLCYADLKTHKYYYWFAIPAVLHPSIRIISLPPFPIQSYFATDQQLALIKSFCIFAQHNVSEADKKAGMVLRPEPYFLVVKRHVGLASVEYLHKYNEIKKSLSLSDEILLGFIDPCPLNTNPGWPLRNLLLLAAVQFKLPNVNVLCFRDVVAAQHLLDGKKYIFLTSFVLTVKFTAAQPGDTEVRSPLPASSPTNLSSPASGTNNNNNNNTLDPTLTLNMNNLTSVTPRVVGWERNKAGKLAPRSMDVAALMDPSRLAEQSADLNLKLMRWRAVPKLDLSVIATSKCLLLGSGTLGCNVARSLLGWGIRYITFVDNGKVSYSNPVRQSLFTFEDCSNSKPKAATAAEAMKKIFPKIHAKGVELTIPMPGHAVNEAELTQTKQDIKKLIDLIDCHDAVFLLTDSRESRWLPTVLCAAKNKICINTALGFDTFLVMRHGDNYIQRPKKSNTQQSDSDTESDESDSEEETKANDKQQSAKKPATANLLDPDDLLNLNQLDLNKQTTAPAPAGAIVVPDDDLLKTFGAATKSTTTSTTKPELPPKSDKYDKAATVIAEQKGSNNNTKSKDESSESDTESDDSDSSVSSDQSDDSEKTKAKKAKKRAKRKARKERRKQRKREKKEKREKEAAAKAAAAAQAKSETRAARKAKKAAKKKDEQAKNIFASPTAAQQYANQAGSASDVRADLGCYFCNDVVAPTDSLKDRSLDQQCTVTRPGLSFLASSLAVELFVTLLQHPQKQRAAANTTDENTNNGLGYLPHQMRGFLTRYNITNVVGSAFKHCTACSNSIIYEYEDRGIDFIIDALNKPASFLEDISGLTIMKKQTEEMMNNTNYEIPDDDDFEISNDNNNNNNDSNNNVDKNNILGIGGNDDKKTKSTEKKPVIDLFADI